MNTKSGYNTVNSIFERNRINFVYLYKMAYFVFWSTFFILDNVYKTVIIPLYKLYMETYIVYNILTAKGTGKYIYGSSRGRRETILHSNFFFLLNPCHSEKFI